MPKATAKAPQPGTLNRGLIIGVSSLPIIFIKFVCLSKSMQIKNGNKAGTMLFTHSINPSFAARYVLFENMIMQIIITSKEQVNKYFLIFTTLKFESLGRRI